MLNSFPPFWQLCAQWGIVQGNREFSSWYINPASSRRIRAPCGLPHFQNYIFLQYLFYWLYILHLWVLLFLKSSPFWSMSLTTNSRGFLGTDYFGLSWNTIEIRISCLLNSYHQLSTILVTWHLSLFINNTSCELCLQVRLCSELKISLSCCILILSTLMANAGSKLSV